MISAVVPALRACPEFNATLDGDMLTITHVMNGGSVTDTVENWRAFAEAVSDAGGTSSFLAAVTEAQPAGT